ncbi:hypothetical protein MSHRCOH1_05920 [Candidatus Ornithobacterium hominis]|uniref:LexA family transcriptional regulator n=1 Tax=Candidatus Ornithobacterium hominis TaxID=2497989 RepID=UPI0024BCFD04|nr:helix-turn-helix domain-containing protein [Candidatus Ornithobacterium hominis]CAI9429730.1 hypothetical protein MSHRCOH1_05920 [Candidatus Ornithobacterium hominis]
MSKKIDRTLILNSIKEAYDFSSNTELAEFLGVKPQTISSWYSRNTFDIDLIYAKCINLNPHFLLTGDGDVLKTKSEENVPKKIGDNLGDNLGDKPNVKKMSHFQSVTKSVTKSVTNQMYKKTPHFAGETKSEENVTLSKGNKKGNKPNVKKMLPFSEETKQEYKVPQVVTVDSNNDDNVVLVPVKAAAGYLSSYDDIDFIKELPSYSLPGIRNGIFRMFEVDGHSMYPTLLDKSYVVGQFVENWATDMVDGRIYVIVSKEVGVVVKRCLNRIQKYGNIFAKSDNRREFPNFTIKPQDISEIWEVKLAMQFNLPDPADMYDKLYDLEAEVENLKLIFNQNF